MKLESGCATIDHHRWGKITLLSEITFKEDDIRGLFSKMSYKSLKVAQKMIEAELSARKLKADPPRLRHQA